MPDQSSDDQSKLVATQDGSHTVYSSRFDQHYHNPNGAVAESRYVFFEQTGLLDVLTDRDRITILEVGFGTGLNLLLLMDYWLNQNSSAQIHFYSVEGFPLQPEITEQLNYQQHLDHPQLVDHLPAIFGNLSSGMNDFTLTEDISLHLFNDMFSNFNPQDLKADYIFHDAFSPDVNPDLWTGKVFKVLRNLSDDDGILSTYSAASKAQGALAWAGWKVAKTQGALGKREMILASPSEEPLLEYKRINEKRYARRYA
jgi:tRNA U34 5-methylaminomethyl-2-thiouridine-forming methyltransferase MnmC